MVRINWIAYANISFLFAIIHHTNIKNYVAKIYYTLRIPNHPFQNIKITYLQYFFNIKNILSCQNSDGEEERVARKKDTEKEGAFGKQGGPCSDITNGFQKGNHIHRKCLAVAWPDIK